MIEYGFFNGTAEDPRYYDADDINEFFKGLITPSGIFANVDNMLQVKPYDTPTMAVKIDTGKAMIDHHWVRNTTVINNVAISAAHPTLYRPDVVVLRLNKTGRTIGPAVIKGEPATSENIVVPSIKRNNSYWDIALAYILVPPNATSISAGNIFDMRLDSTVCGFITGLITQFDTSRFYEELNQWRTEQMSIMSSWENQMQSQFDSWFSTLTSELNVSTFIEKYHKLDVYNTTNVISLDDIQGYTYESSDVFFVNINGLLAVQNKDYVVFHDSNGTGIRFLVEPTSVTGVLTYIDITILKSKIGFDTLIDSSNNSIVTNNNDNVSIGG